MVAGGTVLVTLDLCGSTPLRETDLQSLKNLASGKMPGRQYRLERLI